MLKGIEQAFSSTEDFPKMLTTPVNLVTHPAYKQRRCRLTLLKVDHTLYWFVCSTSDHIQQMGLYYPPNVEISQTFQQEPSTPYMSIFSCSFVVKQYCRHLDIVFDLHKSPIKKLHALF